MDSGWVELKQHEYQEGTYCASASWMFSTIEQTRPFLGKTPQAWRACVFVGGEHQLLILDLFSFQMWSFYALLLASVQRAYTSCTRAWGTSRAVWQQSSALCCSFLSQVTIPCTAITYCSQAFGATYSLISECTCHKLQSDKTPAIRETHPSHLSYPRKSVSVSINELHSDLGLFHPLASNKTQPRMLIPHG